MKILSHEVVARALTNSEIPVLHAVQAAYLLHSEGETAIPFSTFLRPPGHPEDRIIALPAYLGGRAPLAGIKWISSFPHNVERGRQRASSVMILNDLDTGYPVALLEASQISAWRTAASAALASHVLHGSAPVHAVALIGCGTINRRTLAFLLLVHPEIRRVLVHDAVPERAKVFADDLQTRYPHVGFQVAEVRDLLGQAHTVSIATTDSSYWLDLTATGPHPAEQVVLHLSLRDLSVGSVLGAFNVVDDADHVCREQTTLHRAEQQVGHRGFIHASLGGLLSRTSHAPVNRSIFSPFGLGILDLAVAAVVLRRAAEDRAGLDVDGFDPGAHLVTEQLAENHHG